MRNGKKPTRAQRIFIEENAGRKLNTRNWLVLKCTHCEMEIVNRKTGNIRTIKKGDNDEETNVNS